MLTNSVEVKLAGNGVRVYVFIREKHIYKKHALTGLCDMK